VWQRLCIKRILGKCQRVLIACEDLVVGGRNLTSIQLYAVAADTHYYESIRAV
jgi:hypothetical protein